jgi:hypothetical protein
LVRRWLLIGYFPPSLQLAATAATWAALQKCWAAEMFVPALADRFLRLALQVRRLWRRTRKQR